MHLGFNGDLLVVPPSNGSHFAQTGQARLFESPFVKVNALGEARYFLWRSDCRNPL